MIRYGWREEFLSEDLERLHAEGFGREPEEYDWLRQVEGHSLGWVCAWDNADLVGFVNVVWDGFTHAFVLDTVVLRTHRGQSIGQQLVAMAIEQARAAGCEWLHVDFDEHLNHFYVDRIGFKPAPAGVIAL